jgi:hypothetical protein
MTSAGWKPARISGSGGVGVVFGALDDLVDQLVHGDEVGTAHVPVGLLAVDDESLRVDDDLAEELGGSGRDIGVRGALDGGDNV